MTTAISLLHTSVSYCSPSSRLSGKELHCPTASPFFCHIQGLPIVISFSPESFRSDNNSQAQPLHPTSAWEIRLPPFPTRLTIKSVHHRITTAGPCIMEKAPPMVLLSVFLWARNRRSAKLLSIATFRIRKCNWCPPSTITIIAENCGIHRF